MKPAIAIPATLLLVYRAYSRNSLTPFGILVAALTATAQVCNIFIFYFNFGKHESTIQHFDP